MSTGNVSAKAKADPKAQAWLEARRRHRLSHAHVQMAREIGLNPKKLGKINNHDQEPWKLPLPEFIEQLYVKGSAGSGRSSQEMPHQAAKPCTVSVRRRSCRASTRTVSCTIGW